MSGICGIFNLDGAPVRDEDLARMTAMLEKRGPDGTGRWRDGSIGLGHTLLGTTPEQVAQPYRHAATGCVITADARLDYRGELLASLGLDGNHAETGDAELILRAYLDWGADCLDRLYGDFAFAIFDPRTQSLFCARDHFGMRLLYYHHSPGKHFVFASSPHPVLVLPDVPYRLNEGRIADFLVPELEWIDYTSTFFDGVYRLPPGHRLTVTAGGIDVAEYWRPTPGPDPGKLTDEEWRAGFLEVFTRSVEARLRAPAGTVCSMLSGGIDSGSVVAVAKDLLAARGDGPLPTFSGTRDEDDPAECPETRAIAAAVQMTGIAPTLLRPAMLATRFDELANGIEEPFDAEMMLVKAIHAEAARSGCKVVLDGGGGDIVLNEASHLVRLVRGGHVAAAMREVTAEAGFWETSPTVGGYLRILRAACVPDTVKRAYRPARDRSGARRSIAASLISREFAARVRIEERFERMRSIFPGDRTVDYATERCDAIRPNVTAGRERYARTAAAHATEARDPFLDRRVVAFMSRLPGHLLMKDGWRKAILRDLMAGRLPDAVRHARGKHHVGWLFNWAIAAEAGRRGLLETTPLMTTLMPYVEPAALARARAAFSDGTRTDALHSVFILSAWLRDNANRPIVTI